MTQSLSNFSEKYENLLNLHNLENPPPLKKNLEFYGVIDDNAWNRPATTSRKIFQFYHKGNQAKQKLIQSLKEQQVEQMKKTDINKKLRILKAKNEDKERLETRMLETNRLQYSSNQMINLWDDDEEKLNRISANEFQIKQMLAKKGVKIRNRYVWFNEWNNFTNIPKKTVEIIANDKIIKNDEEAIKFISKNLQNEKKSDEIKKYINLAKRQKELAKTKETHLKNFNFEQKIYGKILPKSFENPTNPEFPYKFYDKSKLLDFFSKKLNKQELFEKLAIPKNNTGMLEKNPLDFKDFRGLLIGDIDERTATQLDNEYIKQLHKSEVLKQNIEKINRSRPQSTISRSSRPKTAKSVFGIKYEVMPEQKLRELEILTKTFSDFNHEKLFENQEV